MVEPADIKHYVLLCITSLPHMVVITVFRSFRV
jgi:hypothetical protein